MAPFDPGGGEVDAETAGPDGGDSAPAAGVGSDASLVRRAAAGERAAFATIYLRYHTGVYRFARMMSGSTCLAEDVTQEVFVTLLRELDGYDEERGALSSYLFGIARNLTRNRLRREGRFVLLAPGAEEEVSPQDDPAEAFARAREIARLRRLIAALPSRYREVLILCDCQGLTYLQAAEALHAPIGTVRSRLNRARQMLADRARQPAPLGAVAGRRCLV